MAARVCAVPLSRRTMLRHVSVRAVAAALYPAVGAIGAPLTAAPDLESHPITGDWLAVTPLGPAELVFDADGGVLAIWPHSGDGPGSYYEYTTSATGIWYPVGPDTLLLSVAAREIDVDGGVTGLVAIMSRPVVSSDGGSFCGSTDIDRLTRTTLDGSTTVLLGASATLEPLSGIRMWPEMTGGQ